MDSKINTNQGLRATIDYSRAPQTSGTKFGDKLSATADAAMATGQLAAAFIPGGAIVSAAISGVATVKNASVGSGGLASSSSALTAPGSTGLTTGGVSTGGLGTGAVGGAAAGGSQGMLDQMQKFQEMNQSFNMQYLQLQQNMQNESRKFSVISNIMKTKHDTAKNSISNLR
jgi:hypothetical protein